MNGGDNQRQQATPSLREEIARILPQQNQKPAVPVSPGPVPAAKPEPIESQRFVLRTMESDLENIKKGQQPSGFNVEKSGKTTPRPAPLMPAAPPPKIGLGPLEKAKPMAPPMEPPKPVTPERPKISLPPKVEQPPPSTPTPIAPPPKRKIGLRRIIIYVLIAFFAFGAIWFLFMREAEEPLPSPTPTVTVTPMPTLTSLREIFGAPEDIVIASDEFSPVEAFLEEVEFRLIELDQIRVFMVVNEVGEVYDFDKLMSLLGISMPIELASSLGINEYLFVIYGQTEEFDSQGNLIITTGTAARFKRLGFIVGVNDTDVARESLANWEDVLDDSFAKLFGLENKTPSSNIFADNVYNGARVRYKNFPFPDLSIDYVISSSFVGKNYLVIANSREEIYSIVDKLLGFLSE